MSTADIDESNTQFSGAWSAFARRSPTGEVLELPEVLIASANVAWSMMNTAFLRSPVETEEALRTTLASAVRYFQPRGHGWIFVVCEDWLGPRLRARAPELFGAHGLQRVMEATGMAAGRLTPPTRPPSPLDIHRVRDAKSRQHIADLNSRCYDMPVEMGREAFDVPGFFEGNCQGYAGYLHGKPITSTAVVQVGQVAYVAMVATLPMYRQRGHAETTLRLALSEARRAWGTERTVLHATPIGLPLYQRMGYRVVTRFHLYQGLPQGS
jgi:ribosomal protein S18 acetylase RimI-like enzyme